MSLEETSQPIGYLAQKLFVLIGKCGSLVAVDIDLTEDPILILYKNDYFRSCFQATGKIIVELRYIFNVYVPGFSYRSPANAHANLYMSVFSWLANVVV